MIIDLAKNQIEYDTSPRVEVSFETDKIRASKSVSLVSVVATSHSASFESIKETFLISKQQKFVETTINQLQETILRDKQYFDEEGIELPNEKTINYATLLMRELATKQILPSKISTLVEEGLCVTFKKDAKNMFFEIYNDGEVGFIVQDSEAKRTLDNKDCYSFSEALHNIESFYI